MHGGKKIRIASKDAFDKMKFDKYKVQHYHDIESLQDDGVIEWTMELLS